MTRTGPIFGCGAMLAFAICFIPAAPAQARITRIQITAVDSPGLANSSLMPRGYTMVWSGWDFAAGTRTANFNTTITLPIAKYPDGSTIAGPAFEYIVSPGASYQLNYPAATLDKSQATLTH